MVAQILSGEIWGKAPSWGGAPSVKAYPGPLPAAASGVEFWAFQPPESPHGPRSYWRRPGPFVVFDASIDVVKLSVAFVRITQDLHGSTA